MPQVPKAELKELKDTLKKLEDDLKQLRAENDKFKLLAVGDDNNHIVWLVTEIDLSVLCKRKIVEMLNGNTFESVAALRSILRDASPKLTQMVENATNNRIKLPTDSIKIIKVVWQALLCGLDSLEHNLTVENTVEVCVLADRLDLHSITKIAVKAFMQKGSCARPGALVQLLGLCAKHDYQGIWDEVFGKIVQHLNQCDCCTCGSNTEATCRLGLCGDNRLPLAQLLKLIGMLPVDRAAATCRVGLFPLRQGFHMVGNMEVEHGIEFDVQEPSSTFRMEALLHWAHVQGHNPSDTSVAGLLGYFATHYSLDQVVSDALLCHLGPIFGVPNASQFVQLPVQVMLLLLAMDDLQVTSEMQTLQTLQPWADAHTHEELLQLLPSLRLAWIPAEELTALLTTGLLQPLKGNASVRLMVEEARLAGLKRKLGMGNQEQVPDDFLCPINCELMKDPVITSDGHCYERAAIARWLRTHNTSPKTNQPLASKTLIPNHSMKCLILEHKEQQSVATHRVQKRAKFSDSFVVFEDAN